MPTGRWSRWVRRSARIDALGAALAAFVAVWVVVAAVVQGGSAAPVVGTLAAASAALIAARAVSALVRWLVPAAMIAVAGTLLLSPGALSSMPQRGPFGYANAAGSFFALAAVAGLMIVVLSRSTWVRALGVTAAVAFAAVPFVRGSLAPAVLVLSAPVALLWARRREGARQVVAAGAALFLIALASTVVLGATARPGERRGGLGGEVISALSSRRVLLWHDALTIMAEHPAMGVGPGRFSTVSPIALSDRDARWAHNEFLQQGAEEGILGLALLVALVGWGFLRAWASASPDAVTALGAAALAIAAIHASVDYVFHFPAIPAAAAALLGAAQASPGRANRARTQTDELDVVGA